MFPVRELGVPGREELAMGAIASGGVIVLNEDFAAGPGLCAATPSPFFAVGRSYWDFAQTTDQEVLLGPVR
ncbi:hypothetical protein Airi02_105190 [Actinoallomurus iriomotensis]|uniref:Uncharacterized protein n=1 Tax=Actinoallomurus iriomotensis TaxID=478107 RepID=A0A9W6SD13_9ACTN|nr:hypothetical protein Airi02_105190 [Actinoallomurus iriomotensis]